MRDWFADFAQEQYTDMLKTRATRATWATPELSRCETDGFDVAHDVARAGNTRATRATPTCQENQGVTLSVAHVAHVAHEKDRTLHGTDGSGWDAEDWGAFFDERAGIAEHDGGLSRAEAEARAFEFCIVEWMNRNPARSESGRCAWCGKPEEVGSTVVVPFGTEIHGHIWLHHHCWSDWHKRRCAEAIEALTALFSKRPTHQEA